MVKIICVFQSLLYAKFNVLSRWILNYQTTRRWFKMMWFVIQSNVLYVKPFSRNWTILKGRTLIPIDHRLHECKIDSSTKPHTFLSDMIYTHFLFMSNLIYNLIKYAVEYLCITCPLKYDKSKPKNCGSSPQII